MRQSVEATWDNQTVGKARKWRVAGIANALQCHSIVVRSLWLSWFQMSKHFHESWEAPLQLTFLLIGNFWWWWLAHLIIIKMQTVLLNYRPSSLNSLLYWSFHSLRRSSAPTGAPTSAPTGVIRFSHYFSPEPWKTLMLTGCRISA